MIRALVQNLRSRLGGRRGSIVVVASLYAVFGLIGLQLAVPPGYATLIWPASGVALAAVLFGGMRLWPGIFIGSAVVNIVVGNAITASGIAWTGLLVAGLIAAGSTLQAMTAGFLIAQTFGIPVRIAGAKGLAVFVLFAGPLPCLIAASIGTATLYGFSLVSADAVARNWTTWWIGDVVGILAILPLALLSPFRAWDLSWRGRALARLPAASLLALALPLAATFYAWKLTSEITYEKNRATFERLVNDSEQALLHRLDTYRQSLDGAAGLYRASETLRSEAWLQYVDALQIEQNLPGINGLAAVEPVKRDAIPQFVRQAGIDGVPDLKIHPPTTSEDLFVVKFIAPLEGNAPAVGLDIAFEAKRYEAAVRSRDTGKPTITSRITLVQDNKPRAGFLLFRPYYREGAPLETLEQRRAAFVRWINAPFIADRFMAGLTASQGVEVDLEIYDGKSVDPDELIYSSHGVTVPEDDSSFAIVKTLRVLQRDWTIVWHATEAFEAGATSHAEEFVLAAGLAVTLLLGFLLYSFARRDEEVQRLVAVKTREIDAHARENRAVFETAVVALMVLDGDRRIIASNKAAHRMFGFAEDAMNGIPIENVVGPRSSDGDGTAADFGPDGDATVLRQVKTRAGEDIVVSLQQNNWQTGEGYSRHTLIIRDITEERRIAGALEESERRMNYALRGAGLGIFDIDLETGKSFVSDTWKEMLGFTAEEEIDPQMEWLARISPEDMTKVLLADADCIEGRKERSESEYRIRDTRGRWRWHRSDAVVIERAADGRALRMIGVQTDVTRLKDAEAALRSSEERFRSAIDNAPVGMALVDTKGEWTQLNGSLCRLLGYRRDELEELHPSALFHPDDREEIARLLSGFKQPIDFPPQSEIRLVHKSGQAIWCLFSMSVVRRQEGEETDAYTVLQFQDITERKEIERLKSEFVATVSHELRTPLTSIRGALGLVMGSQIATLPPAVSKLLRIAHSNCERLIQLINDILDLEKITSGMVAFDLERYPAEEVVKRAIDNNQPIFDRNGLTLSYSGGAEGALVEIDEARLQQVLSNLLSNAAKFAKPSGTVQIRIERFGERLRVSVEDDGPGVPPEFRSRIFQRFNQADSSSTRAKGGTGLGLNISKTIIEKMGGRIDFYDAPGGGAVFWFDLPVCETIGLMPAPAPESSPVPMPGPRLISSRGLHVEVDRDFSEIVAAMLPWEIELSRSDTLHQAKALLAEQDFAFLVLDGFLPDGCAVDLLRQLRADGRQIPAVILATADVEYDDPAIIDVIVKSRASETEIVRAIVAASRRLAKVA